MRRTFLSLIAALFLTSSFLAPAPVRGDDEKDDAKKEAKKGKDEKAKAKEDDKKKKDKPSPIKRLVEIKLDPYLVPAQAINIPLPGRVKTSQALLERLEKLAKDDEVGAILLNLDGLTLDISHIEELRAGLAEFKKSGKKVAAFLNAGEPMGYLLACEADEIAVAPSGMLIIPGIGRIFPFMRGMYQMRGIEYEVITAGKFKYGGFLNRREPDKHFLDEFGAMLDSWYDDYVEMIAKGRNLPVDRVKKAIDIALFEPEDAKNRGLVDVIAYYDDYRDRIIRREKFKKTLGDDSKWARITSLQDLLSQVTKEMKEAQEGYKAVGPKIAVLHGRGPIVDMNLGAGFASSLIMRDEFVKSIEEIRKNKTIRAVVLHIDSPGGSAYASDVIWKKLRELDEEKPLVISMGSMAASGGYYIACPGRLIFAQPTTLTGSIGVISILANQASAINRMDVNLEEMKRGERSLFGSGHRDLKPEDRALLQKYILSVYEQFLDRVAAGRKIPKDELRKLAQGRIYTGRQALEIGLVDRLGTLKDAVDAVREMADIPASAEIKLVHYPRPASLGELAESFFGMSALVQVLEQANAPAPEISFDNQVRFFARSPKPLCWMAMPNPHAAFSADGLLQGSPDLFDLLTRPHSPTLLPLVP
ncbi:MAG: signal peptide peptidase SppA [Planctomycetota bacterium]